MEPRGSEIQEELFAIGDRIRALAQELVVREGVQYLGGLFYTPDAVAVAQVSEQAKVPTVVFNAATSSLIDRSKYLLRVSYTQPQVTVPMAQFALKEGFKSVATIVSDYASGADVEKNFETAFTAGGGKITIKIRAPLDTIDFSPFMQTIKNSKPQAVLAFTPGGVISIGFVKAFRDVGLQTEGVRLLGIGGEVDEASVLPALGDIALGTYSSNFYVPTRRSASNDAFSQSFKGLFPNSAIGPTTLEAFDGMSLLYRMIGATNGKRDPDAAMVAAKGYKWESPRGPMEVDASNRDLIQNVYIRKVEKSASGAMFNNLVQTYEHQPDYGRINEGRTTGPAKAP